MDAVRSYLLRIIVAAILGNIMVSILPEKNGIAGLIRFIAGVYLTVTIIQPLVRFDFSSIEEFLRITSADYLSPTAEGEQYADSEMNEYIKSSTQTYILDKVNSLGADADVQIELTKDDLPVPESVRISGEIPDTVKSQLEVFLETELGIKKENQLWICDK